MKPAKCTIVYVAEGIGEYKIGVASNIRRRFTHLKRDGATRIVGCWHRPRDAFLIEGRAHALLGRSRRRRGTRTEWFRVSEQIAVAAVIDAMGNDATEMTVPSIGFDFVAFRAEGERLNAEFDAWIQTPEGAEYYAKLMTR